MQVEALYAQLGLRTPLTRFAATGAAVFGVLYLVQPTLMFQDGKMRPWSVTTSGSSKDPSVTPTPFSIGVASVVGGAIAAIFV